MDAQSQNQFAQAVLLILVFLVSGAVVMYLLKLWQVKQSELTQNKWALFNWIVAQAVIGVEQLWRARIIEKDARLDNAVAIVQREIDAWGLRGIDVERITQACMAGVGRELNQAKLIAGTVPPPALPDIPIGPQN